MPMTARVSVFKNRENQAVRIPKAMAFPEDVKELEISRVGNVITLRPPRKSWSSFAELPLADEDFLAERPDVVGASRVDFGEDG
ncbi:MAG: type II toxin-antitoxin system VapB family antitoxin [Propionibacteriaceae bacterium]|jgi:antitoxin VapB|nr:type II toxin-antitoxin system VapB family antitoxin [Propionibacteriaceae bacterium]